MKSPVALISILAYVALVSAHGFVTSVVSSLFYFFLHSSPITIVLDRLSLGRYGTVGTPSLTHIWNLYHKASFVSREVMVL